MRFSPTSPHHNNSAQNMFVSLEYNLFESGIVYQQIFKNYPMQCGPCGRLSGMRWCGETNRYYAELPNGAPTDIVTQAAPLFMLQNQLESVRLAPVDIRIVKTLPFHKKRAREESPECSICLRTGLDHRSDPRSRFVQLPCRHRFHLYCVEKWLAKLSGSCPSCRTAVDTSMAVAARTLNRGNYY